MIIHLPIDRGICLFPWFIIVPNWAKGSEGYLAHEQTHADQQRKVGVFHFWFKYLRDKSFRQEMEVEAYRKQIAISSGFEQCAWNLCTKYNLKLSLTEARLLLGQR